MPGIAWVAPVLDLKNLNLKDLRIVSQNEVHQNMEILELIDQILRLSKEALQSAEKGNDPLLKLGLGLKSIIF